MEDWAAGEWRDALPVGVSSSRQLCRQHNQNFTSNSLCDRNLSVTVRPLGAGDPEAKAAPCLQADDCGPCSVPGAHWASAVSCPQLLETGVTQDEEH